MPVYKGQDNLTDIAHVEGLQDAFNRRAIYNYKWLTYAEKDAETGMRRADEGFLVPSGETYKYEGSTWKLWHMPEADYEPRYSLGFTLGNGTHAASWSVHAGLATMSMKATLGSTSVVNGDIRVNPPVASNTPRVIFGSGGRMIDASAGNLAYDAHVILSGTFVSIRPTASAGAYTTVGTTSATVPFTWATGDSFEFTATWIL